VPIKLLLLSTVAVAGILFAVHTKVSMLQKTQAVLALQDGCKRLGLPSSTATALVQFLSVKRTHDQYVAAESRQLRMSPGTQMDRLWHFMLLNTDGMTWDGPAHNQQLQSRGSVSPMQPFGVVSEAPSTLSPTDIIVMSREPGYLF
jgi:hypothetical protein